MASHGGQAGAATGVVWATSGRCKQLGGSGRNCAWAATTRKRPYGTTGW